MNTSDLLNAANKHYEEYSAYVYNQFSDKKEGTKFIKRTIYMSLAADKELTHGEVTFINSFWGSDWSYQEFYDYVNVININFYKKELQKLPFNAKWAYLNIITAICCCDEWLMGIEKQFIEDIWEGK